MGKAPAMWKCQVGGKTHTLSRLSLFVKGVTGEDLIWSGPASVMKVLHLELF